MNGSFKTIDLLLVEDNPSDRTLLETKLKKIIPDDYHLWHAQSIATAVSLLHSHPFDIILLDLNVHDGSGLDSLQRILPLTSAPILVTSNSKDRDLALKALQHGAEDYIIKEDISSEVLKHRLHQVIERQRLLHTLMVQEARLREIIDKNSDGIVVVNSDGMICFANPAAEKLFGRSSGELIGFPFGFPITGTERTEVEILHGKGIITSVELQTVNFEWEEHPALLVSLRDVTERKQEEERIRRIVESAPNAIMLVGNDGKLRLVNTQAEQYFGYDRNELNGMEIELLIPDRYRVYHPQLRTDFLAKPQSRRMGIGRDLYGLRKDGKDFPIEVGLTPLEIRDEQLVMVTIIDITERKLAEEERENLIKELTSKNTELEQFIYTVSHDLKSPLVTIKGFLGYLEQDAVSGNMERIKSDTQRISKAVEKMHELMGDLLKLSRIRHFINPPESVPFEYLAKEAIGLVKGQILKRGVVVELQPDLPTVYGDKLRLLEVLQNLLDNAVKYMGNQAHPHIQIGHRNEGANGNQPVFFVRDNGIGIALEYHERVFGLFNKLDPKSEGTGVGLTLVQRIIDLHGGRVWVESELGQGSIFYFTLPIVKPN